MVKPWAVLVYIVADHDAPGTPFKGSANRELRALLRAAGTAKMDVAVQIDYNRQARPVRIAINPTKGSIKVRRRFRRIDPSKFEVTRQFLGRRRLVKVRVSRGDEVDAASPDVLCQFLRWGRKQLKAERYAIFFFGHAAGPAGLFFDNLPGSSLPHAMSLSELARAVESAEVVVFRDCWMSTLEIAYQLHGVAKFAIATQAQATLRGRWPYADLFAILQATADGNEAAVARALTMRIGSHYDVKGNRFRFATVPFTMLDLRQVRRLTTPLRDLARALEASRSSPAAFPSVRLALEQARSGHVESSVRPGDNALLDVHALCNNLVAASKKERRSASRALEIGSSAASAC